MTRRDDYDDMREKGLAPHLSYPVKIVGAIILISVALIGLSALLMAAAGNGQPQQKNRPLILMRMTWLPENTSYQKWSQGTAAWRWSMEFT